MVGFNSGRYNDVHAAGPHTVAAVERRLTRVFAPRKSWGDSSRKTPRSLAYFGIVMKRGQRVL